METPTVRQMFSALIHNDQAMTVVITIVLINCSLYITSNLLLYFFKYDVSGESWYNSYTLFSTFGGAVQILSMMVLFPLLRKFMSSIRVFYLSFGMAIAGYAILLVLMIGGHTVLGALVVPGFLIFAAFGMLTVLTTVFLANTVDYGEMKNIASSNPQKMAELKSIAMSYERKIPAGKVTKASKKNKKNKKL